VTELVVSLLIALTYPPAPAPAPPRPVPRILCVYPNTLHLRRFEDRSAQLLCRGRVLLRVAVPG
jgi:hypothetical protein